MINAGMLRDRISFLAAEKTVNEYGEEVTTWAERYACRARVTFNRGQRAINGGEVWLPNTVAILMRNTKAVGERMRIVWDGKTYIIDSLNAMGATGELNIVATRMDEGTGN